MACFLRCHSSVTAYCYDQRVLKPIRRHVQSCSQFGKFDTDCPSKMKKKCPFVIHIYERVLSPTTGKFVSRRREKALGTTDPKVAAQLVNDMVRTGESKPKNAPRTVKGAVDLFLEQETARGIADSTTKSFRKFLCGNPKRNPKGNYSPTLLEFAKKDGIGVEYLQDFTPDHILAFRGLWKVNRRCLTVQAERLNQFFKHAHDTGWITENPTAKLKAPKVELEPVVAFGKDERDRIFAALKGDVEGIERNEFLLTFNLVMKYSGLATVDAIYLGPNKLHGDYLITRRKKTGKRVQLKMPPILLERLKALPVQGGGFWFWNQKKSEAKHETATGNLRRMMRPYFAAANVYLHNEDGDLLLDDKGKPRLGHLYQWRHTFVHLLLEKGTTSTRIAELIGDSVKTVDETYSHFIKECRPGLDQSQEATWDETELAGAAKK